MVQNTIISPFIIPHSLVFPLWNHGWKRISNYGNVPNAALKQNQTISHFDYNDGRQFLNIISITFSRLNRFLNYSWHAIYWTILFLDWSMTPLFKSHSKRSAGAASILPSPLPPPMPFIAPHTPYMYEAPRDKPASCTLLHGGRNEFVGFSATRGFNGINRQLNWIFGPADFVERPAARNKTVSGMTPFRHVTSGAAGRTCSSSPPPK